LLGEFTKTDSEVTLLGIAIVMPMLVLSGFGLPVEFLTPPMDQVGRMLPLYIAREGMSKITIRGLTLADAFKEYASLTFFILLCLGLAYLIRKRKE